MRPAYPFSIVIVSLFLLLGLPLELKGATAAPLVYEEEVEAELVPEFPDEMFSIGDSATVDTEESQSDFYYFPPYDEAEMLIRSYVYNGEPEPSLSELEQDFPELLAKHGSWEMSKALRGVIIDTYKDYDFETALRLTDLALSMAEGCEEREIYQKEDFLYFKILLLRVSGDYQEAVKLGIQRLRELEAREKEGELSYNELSQRNEITKCLSEIYFDLGNFEEWARYQTLIAEAELAKEGYMAEEYRDYLRRALAFFKTADFSRDWRSALERFAGLMYDQKMLDEMLTRKNKIDSDPMYQTPPYNLFVVPQKVNLLMYISNVYYYRHDYSEAIPYGEEGLKICRDQENTSDVEYRKLLECLGRSKMELGRYQEAIPVLLELVEKKLEVFPESHPEVLGTKRLVAECMLRTGDERVVGYAGDISENVQSLVRDNFAYMSAPERTKYWDLNSSWFFDALPRIAAAFTTSETIGLVYDCLLLGKGLLLNSEIEIKNLIEESGDKELADKFNRQIALKKQISNLNVSTDEERIKKLSSESVELERELLRACKIYGDYTSNLSIGWKEVQSALGENEAAIEFLAVPDADGGQQKKYVALVLAKDFSAPQWIELFTSETLDSVPQDEYYTSPALYNLIWGPLEGSLEGKTTVYFSPDQDLHRIAMEYLPAFKDEKIIKGDSWENRKLVRLSSTRKLLKPENPVEGIREAVIYGDISYDVDPKSMTAYNAERENEVSFLKGETNDNVRKRLRELETRGGVRRLHGSGREIEEINALLQKADVRHHVYSGADASETSFKDLSGKGIDLLHIATHGFYLSPVEAYGYEYPFLQDGGTIEDEALTRSGLLFAGANHILKNQPVPETADDGVLTARELACLDFRGLDLAVLSACQTGLGDITGDGIFGLQRGFKKAGANTLLMSLWKVDDNATQLLMTEFYRNYMAGKTKYESLQIARDKLRNLAVTDHNGNETHPYQHPQWWAAFVLLDALD